MNNCFLSPHRLQNVQRLLRFAWMTAALWLAVGCSSATPPPCTLGTPTAESDLYGTVCDPTTARPIQRAVVTVHYWAEWPDMVGQADILARTFSDLDGNFAFPELELPDPSIPFWVEAYADGYQNRTSEECTADPDEPVGVLLELEPEFLGVYGVVTDARTGDPIEDARIWIDLEPERLSMDGLMTRFTVSDGQYRFYGVPTGTQFEVGAMAEGYEQRAELHTIESTEAIEVNLALTPSDQPLGPHMWVHPTRRVIVGFLWSPDSNVSVLIGNTTSPDFSAETQTNEEGYFEVWEIDHDIAVGDRVRVSDGLTTKTHTVMEIEITGGDAENDTVEGITSPGVWVDVRQTYADEPFPMRRIQADSEGHWLADFSEAAGDEVSQQPLDIKPDCVFDAIVGDEDGDRTVHSYQLPNPWFIVDLDYSAVQAWDWPPDTDVTVTIGDLTAPDSTYHFHTDEVGMFFEGLRGYQVQAGDLVTMSDGTTTKTHVVSRLAVASIDVDADMISGVATPDAMVQIEVQVEEEPIPVRWIQADGDGNWAADFSEAVGPGDEDQPFDIVLGSSGVAQELDEDGDCTAADWAAPNTQVNVDPAADHIWGHEWLASTTLTLTIGEPTSPDFSANPQTDEWGNFDLNDIALDIAAGHLVTVSDGATTKSHTVTGLEVTSVDAVYDTVSGSADSETEVQVWAFKDEQSAFRNVVTDADNDWMADFSQAVGFNPEELEFNLEPGVSGYASQMDEDNDSTFLDWSVTE
ncbi:MAG: carboxypeptidase regulatory-like domain-containing protein [Bradymonadales bacterium]|nr:carboxypeptidase regulatory-like domain-containing protein [Bradymonadales bacterium]